MYQWVEFMGLPGAGKTTLAKGFLRHLRSVCPGVLSHHEAVKRSILLRDDGLLRNIAKKFPPFVWEPLSGMRNALPELHLFATNNVELCSHIFSALSQEEMSTLSRQCIVYTFFQLFAEHQILLQHLGSDTFVVAEEGLAQAGSMLYGYLPSRSAMTEEVIRYVGLIPKGRALIWIDTPVEHCLSRLKLRDELPIVLQKEGDEGVDSFLRQARVCFQTIFSHAEKQGVVQVFKVENDDQGLEQAVCRLEKIAEELQDGR